MDDGQPKRLDELKAALTGLESVRGSDGHAVSGIASDTRALRSGEVFVALPGTHVDGRVFIGEAVRRGAAAVVTECDVEPPGVPVLRVRDARAALAELAAAWHDWPSERLTLVGITGTLGKTSTLSMLEAVLRTAGIRTGSIGSLGIRSGDRVERTRLTTPEPLKLQHALAAFVADEARAAVMEVTSHALSQRRVHGLTYDLGIFTNVALLEHRDYHGSFQRYVQAKSRFFDLVKTGAPLVYPVGDRVVRTIVRGRKLSGVSCGPGGRVSVRTERLLLDRGGTRIHLTSRVPLPRVGGGEVRAFSLPIELQVLGRPNIINAVLAATAGLCLGAEPEAVRGALSAFPAPWRRMQIAHRGRFTVLDDTVGHPDSIGAVFEVARKISHRGLHVIYAVRGGRGEEINRRDAETIAIWAECTGLDSLYVTSSEECVDEANRVSPGEREAFLGPLKRHGVAHIYTDRLGDAVDRLLDGVGDRDLVLLLGAQGMNRGAALLRERL